MTYNINIDDYIGRWGYSKQYIRNQLPGLKGKPVNVRISSLGGAVDDGLDIRQQFIDHGDVTVYLYGMVASSATIAAQGAKKVCISKYCMFLVHKVSNWVDAWGQYNADQIEELIVQLKENKLENDKFDLVLANMYASKCKKKVDEILDVLKAGRWLTAQEALDYGFVDEIIEGADDKIDLASASEKQNVLGLPPLPGNPDKSDNTDTITNKLISKMEAFLTSFGKKNELPPSDTHTNIKTMKKDYVKVNTILNVEGLEFDKDGKCNLTEDQVKALNEKMNALEQDVTDKQTLIDQKEEQITNLKKGDGDGTSHIEGGEGGDKLDVFKEAKDLYNSL